MTVYVMRLAYRPGDRVSYSERGQTRTGTVMGARTTKTLVRWDEPSDVRPSWIATQKLTTYMTKEEELSRRITEAVGRPFKAEYLQTSMVRRQESEQWADWFQAYDEGSRYGLYAIILEDGTEEWTVAHAEDGVQASPEDRTYDLDGAAHLLNKYEFPARIPATVAELEDYWGHTRDEWGLYGPVVEDDTTLAFVRSDEPPYTYRLDRQWDDGSWHTASDVRFELSEIPVPAIEAAERIF
jgi:hypothetical protein